MRKLYSYMGSKGRYLDVINNLINNVGSINYYEPFLGSGIIFLNLEKEFKKYYLNDIFPDLLLFFNNYSFLDKKYINNMIDYELNNFNIEKNKKKYYELREIMNNEKDLKRKTILFWMIANTCINNMVRFNSNTLKFNQSYGNRKYTNKIETFLSSIDYCNKKNIYTSVNDFKAFFSNINNTRDNFVFIDPPYFLSNFSSKWDKEKTQWIINWLIKNDKVQFIYTDIESELTDFLLKNRKDLEYSYHQKIKNISPNRKKEISHKEIFIHTGGSTIKNTLF